MARGGHYSSLEAPEAFVEDMRAFAEKLAKLPANS
jgi:hypothetical protein